MLVQSDKFVTFIANLATESRLAHTDSFENELQAKTCTESTNFIFNLLIQNNFTSKTI